MYILFFCAKNKEMNRGVCMRVFDLFSKYFLLMVIIQGSIVGFYDSTKMKKLNLYEDAKLARKIGLGSIIISGILCIVKIIII